MILTSTSVRQYAYNAGFREPALSAAVAIAQCESGLNTDSHCLNCLGVNEDSRGLWQINILSNANPQYAAWDLFNPEQNARAAFEIYKQWGNFGAWTCAKKLGLVNPGSNGNTATETMPLAILIFLSLYLLS